MTMADRDPDLQTFYDAADRIGVDGVRALIDRLQEYRQSARNACIGVADIAEHAETSTDVVKLRALMAEIDQALAQWQWQIELENLEVKDFILKN
jgi:hypothetical protein